MRNNTSEQVPLCWFDLRWLTWQKGQCRADGPYFRSQEAPSRVNWNQPCVRRQRPLSFCRHQSARARKHLATGADCQWPPLVLCHTSKPCAIHLQHTAAAHLSFLEDQGLRSEMQALPVLCLLGSMIFWLLLSLFMPLAQARRGPVVCPAQSSDFKLQGCRNSWPYSWIHLFATGRQRRTL